MATFDITPLFRTTSVGIDRAWDQLNTTLSLDGNGYPAYNILRTGEEEFRISLAVPGFTDQDISVETKELSVWVKGERKVDADHNRYLYRGFNLSGFQRCFQLPDHVRVQQARLEAGMLHIDLIRELPEALRPQKIEVINGDQSRPVLEDSSRAA
jgi:molecular chaperone IbpA